MGLEDWPRPLRLGLAQQREPWADTAMRQGITLRGCGRAKAVRNHIKWSVHLRGLAKVAFAFPLESTHSTQAELASKQPSSAAARLAKVIARMRELRKPASGPRTSFAAIARALNADGLTNRTGRPWSSRFVQHVLMP